MKSILEEAQELIHGNRQQDYGPPTLNHGCTALMWSGWLKRKYNTDIDLDCEDVCFLNALQKISRHANKSKRDNLVDIAGYMGCVEMLGEGGKK